MRQYEDKLVLRCNSIRDGHTHVVWFNEKTPDLVREMEIEREICVIEGLEQGDYVFYTRGPHDQSLRLYLYFLRETGKEKVLRIEQFLAEKNAYHQRILEALTARLEKFPERRPTNILADLFKELKTEESEAYACFELIRIAQFCENTAALLMGRDNHAGIRIEECPRLKLRIDSSVTNILIFECVNDKKVYHCTLHAALVEHADLILPSGKLFSIEAYIDHALVCEAVYFSGTEECLTTLWQKQISQKATIDEKLDRTIALPVVYDQFSEAERVLYQMQRRIEPYDALVDRPVCGLVKDGISIDLDGYPLLEALDQPFYVAVKDADRLSYADYERKELVLGERVVMHSIGHLLGDKGEYQVYLQNAKREAISKFQLISLTGRGNSDYEERVRRLELYEYEKRLLPILRYRVAGSEVTIKQLLRETLDRPDLNVSNIVRHLLEQLFTDQHAARFVAVSAAILEDDLNNRKLNRTFFETGIKVQPELCKLVFPPKQDAYVLQVDTMTRNAMRMLTYYHRSGSGAIELRTDDADFYLFRAIDRETFARSGFILIDNTRSEPSFVHWNIDVEVI